MVYDLIIVGGGPAAVGAGVYAARKQLRTALFTEEFGGQSVVSSGIQNWIGTVEISGADLAKNLKEHLLAYAEGWVDVHEGTRIERITGEPGNFVVHTKDGATYTSKTVLIAAGARRRKLDVPGANTFEHKGLTYCATCDGPLFSGMDVVVIGGGNAGFESAAQLLAYAKSVTLLDVGDDFKAEATTVTAVLAHQKMTAIKNAKTTEIEGEAMVSGIAYEDTSDNSKHSLPVQGVFVEIGTIPNTDMVAELVTLNKHNHIEVDAKTQRASVEGIWAAGDCTDGLYAQNNIAVGDAVKALEDIYVYLRTQ